MALTRKEAREKCMVIIYQTLLYNKNNIEYDLDTLINNETEVTDEYINNISNGVFSNLDSLTEIANKYLGSWPLHRLGVTDQAIILIGVYELLHTDTPKIVCINEAIELSHKYSDEQVSKIVNGVLDNVYHKEVENAE